MVDKRTRLTETREDVYKDIAQGRFDDPDISFQQFSAEVDDTRDNLGSLVNDVGAGLMASDRLDPINVQERVETDVDDLFNARRSHEERSELSQKRDQATNANTVTGDFETWMNNKNRYDFPGVDTKDNIQPKF